MSGETERIYTKLGQLAQEITNLRQGYVILNKRCGETLGMLNDLTVHAIKAAKRAAVAAARALDAVNSATNAARASSRQWRLAIPREP